MRLGVAGDDYNTEEAVIFKLVEWAMASKVHVHLVAHARTGERDRGVPETGDIEGAMEIGANAFNIVSVWRDRKLEEKVGLLRDSDPAGAARLFDSAPGVILNVAKQRNATSRANAACGSTRNLTATARVPMARAGNGSTCRRAGRRRRRQESIECSHCGEALSCSSPPIGGEEHETSELPGSRSGAGAGEHPPGAAKREQGSRNRDDEDGDHATADDAAASRDGRNIWFHCMCLSGECDSARFWRGIGTRTLRQRAATRTVARCRRVAMRR
jgi:hypothetical protein